MSYTCNLKFSSSHIKKKKKKRGKEAGKINFYYLFNPMYSKVTISTWNIKIINELFYTLLGDQDFGIQCVFPTHSTSQFRPAPFQDLSTHTCPVATTLDSITLCISSKISLMLWHQLSTRCIRFSKPYL